jgi:hypothetical protein
LRRKGSDDIVELPSMAVPTGYKGNERPLALVPVMQIAAFIVDNCCGRLEFHGKLFSPVGSK